MCFKTRWAGTRDFTVCNNNLEWNDDDNDDTFGDVDVRCNACKAISKESELEVAWTPYTLLLRSLTKGQIILKWFFWCLLSPPKNE